MRPSSRISRISRRHALATLAGGLAAPAVLCARANAQASFDERLKATVGEIAASLAKHHVAGASLVIVKDGRIVFLGQHGKRDLATGLPATADTLFPLASVSKTFTSIAAAIAVEEGKLAWTSHPRPLVPTFKLRDPAADQKVTISELLDHTTGLARGDLFWMIGGLELPDLLRVAGEAEALVPFGQTHIYNNQTFAAAGAMVGAAYGTTWGEFVRRRILAPLGMSATRTSVAGLEQAADHAKGYQFDEKGGHSRLLCNPMDIVAPAGAVCSTARDLGAYLVMLSEGGIFNSRRIVSEASLAHIWTPRVDIAGNMRYGLGWFTIDVGGMRIPEHGGNAWGYTSELAVFPGHRLAMALLTNADSSAAGKDALAAVLKHLVDRPAGQGLPAALAMPPERRDGREAAALAEHQSALPDLLGQYRDGLDEAEVRLDGEHYMLSLIEGTFRLTAAGDDRFHLDGRPADHFVRPERGPGNAIAGLVIVEGGSERRLARVPDLIDGPEIIRRMIEAAGGEEELKRITSLVIRGRITLPNEGTSARFTRLAAAPYFNAETEAVFALGRQVGTRRNYFDGERFGVEIGSGHRPGAPSIVGVLRVLNHIHRAITQRTDTREAVVGGRTQFGGRDAHTLRAVSQYGEIERLIVDAETFLPLRQDAVEVGPSGERIVARTFYGDWRVVRGISLRMPYKELRIRGAGERELVEVDEIVLDTTIPAAEFGPRLPIP